MTRIYSHDAAKQRDGTTFSGMALNAAKLVADNAEHSTTEALGAAYARLSKVARPNDPARRDKRLYAIRNAIIRRVDARNGEVTAEQVRAWKDSIVRAEQGSV